MYSAAAAMTGLDRTGDAPGDRQLGAIRRYLRGLGPCRVLRDPPAEGAWNMAVDEALLHSARDSGRATLRFYSWCRPTLSLGYFQSYAQRAAHAASAACPVVRRPTGGGAILHDVELTYCLAVPLSSDSALSPRGFYGLMHGTLVEALGGFGIVAARSGERAQSLRDREPFLCFERRSADDVLLRGAKIAGSAQRRRRGALVQHGSVLLEAAACADHLPGVAELCGRRLEAGELADRWIDALLRQLDVEMPREKFTDQEQLAAAGIETTLKDDSWIRRRP